MFFLSYIIRTYARITECLTTEAQRTQRKEVLRIFCVSPNNMKTKIMKTQTTVVIETLPMVLKIQPNTEVLNVKKSLIKIAQNMLNFGRRIKIF